QITVQPAATQTVCEGGTINLSVTAIGAGLTYQWYNNANPLGGQTSSTLTLINADASNAGNYTVRVFGTCDATGVLSTVSAVTIQPAPSVTFQPSIQTIWDGGNTTLIVAAVGTVSPGYQWQVNRNDGAGYVDLTADGTHSNITPATLSINGAPLSHNGYLYRAVVTSGGVCTSSAISNAAVLTVQQAPQITVQPAATQTVCEGGTINLSVTAVGAGLTYQWYNNANPLGGQTSSTLTLINADASNAGNYTVRVFGTCDATGVLSTVSAVTIQPAPSVTLQPSNQTICEGGNTTLTVAAVGTVSPGYQWQVNRNDGAGYVNLTADGIHSNITTATLSINGAPLSHNGYLYRAVVTSGGVCTSSAISNAAVLTVQQAPQITVQPAATQTVCEGGTINLSVTAVGAGLTYQWYNNANPLGGQTSSTLTLINADASNAGNYTVRVFGTCDATGVLSTVSAVTIQPAPSVTLQPSNQTICEGGNTTLTVAAVGTVSPGYQWQVNRNDGAGYVNLTADGIHSNITTATLSINGAPLSHNGYLYRAVVTSGGVCTSSAISNAAVLTVQQAPQITVQPAATQTVCEGGTINLSVTAVGAGLTYQWYNNANPLGGQTSSTLTLINADASNAGNYTVRVFGTCDATGVLSTVSAVTIQPAPSVTLQPSNQTICEGGNTT